MHYFGLDWLSAVLLIVGMYQISDKKRIGFLLCAIGLGIETAVFVMADTYPLAALNIALLLINLRAYAKWETV